MDENSRKKAVARCMGRPRDGGCEHFVPGTADWKDFGELSRAVCPTLYTYESEEGVGTPAPSSLYCGRLRSHEFDELHLAAGDVVDGGCLLRVTDIVVNDLAGHAFIVNILQRVPHHGRIIYPGLGDGLQ